MPPIARLSPEQAVYHFISGYTSKVGGTEVGLGEEPEITFSACFGAPFMVHHPMFTRMLRSQDGALWGDLWLLNTGWVGGPYGVGKRISIRYTRDLLTAALKGQLQDVDYYEDEVFGFHVPKSCPGVPDEVLYPAERWPSKAEYDARYRSLAARFIDNFRKFAPACPPEVVGAGPKV
jgi:phosphoenolpyruvate carboxykinase (ATP)